jgi:hypothetical protein
MEGQFVIINLKKSSKESYSQSDSEGRLIGKFFDENEEYIWLEPSLRVDMFACIRISKVGNRIAKHDIDYIEEIR